MIQTLASLPMLARGTDLIVESAITDKLPVRELPENILLSRALALSPLKKAHVIQAIFELNINRRRRVAT